MISIASSPSSSNNQNSSDGIDLSAASAVSCPSGKNYDNTNTRSSSRMREASGVPCFCNSSDDLSSGSSSCGNVSEAGAVWCYSNSNKPPRNSCKCLAASLGNSSSFSGGTLAPSFSLICLQRVASSNGKAAIVALVRCGWHRPLYIQLGRIKASNR